MLEEIVQLTDSKGENYEDVVELQRNLSQLHDESRKLAKRIEDKELEYRMLQVTEELIGADGSKKAHSIKSNSGRSGSKSSRTSSSRASSKQSERAAKAARLRTELKFLDIETQKETDLKRLEDFALQRSWR